MFEFSFLILALYFAEHIPHLIDLDEISFPQSIQKFFFFLLFVPKVPVCV